MSPPPAHSRTRRLARKLVLAVALAALGGAAGAGLLAERAAAGAGGRQLASQLRALANATAAALPPARVEAATGGGPEAAARSRLRAQLAALAGAQDTHEVFVLTADGSLVSTTGDADARSALVALDRVEVAAAQAAGIPQVTAPYKDASGTPFQVGYASIRAQDGRTVGVVGVEVSAPWFTELDRMRSALTLLGIGAAAVAAALGALFARTLSARLQAVSEGARQIGAGRWGVRIGAAGDDELGDVARALDGLGEAVQQREETIRTLLSAALEGTVQSGPGGVAPGVLQVDGDGVIRSAGDQARTLLARRDLVGLPVADLLSGSGPELAHLIVSRQPLLAPTGSPLGEVVFLHDRQTLDTARRADEERRRLVAAGELASLVAHEIRTPLNALSLELGLMRRDLAPGAALETVDRSLAEIRRLEETIRGFLDLARPLVVQADELPIADLLAAVEVHAAHELALHGARLEVSPCVASVAADPALAVRALGNLVRNAAAACSGGVVRIAVEQHGGQVHLIVSDDGPGIAPAMRARLFEPFATGRADGAGLGLVLARRIARAHGGDCSLIETGPAGTRFVLTLPCASGSGARATPLPGLPGVPP